MKIKVNKKNALFTMLFLISMFLVGRGAGFVVDEVKTTMGVNMEAQNWGLGFGAEGQQPTGTASVDEMKKYDAYFLGNNQDKILYLTFDCGYENGNTPAILDALKKHNVTATFFVVGHFLESEPELVKRMVAEGHTVGNHTYHHPDVSQISDESKFAEEMNGVSDLFKQITGQEISSYYRPPQGKYSIDNLKMAQKMGYQTFFWSLAYVDWNQDSQPSHEEAFSKLTSRVHPGAVVLLHNTSKTNGEILDELLSKWEAMGYQFGTLDQLTGKTAAPAVEKKSETSIEAINEEKSETSTEALKEEKSETSTEALKEEKSETSTEALNEQNSEVSTET